MSVRRGIIFAYIVCGTLLVAHIINAVIAEALSVPVGLVRPAPISNQETETRTSVPAMVEHIRTSGLFPLPSDPLGMSPTAGLSAALPRVSLNLAAALQRRGGVLGDP